MIDGDEQKILYTFPVVKTYTSQPLTKLNIDRNRSDSTTDNITSDISGKRSTMINPTQSTFVLDDITSDIPVNRSMMLNPNPNTNQTGQLLVPSIGVGTLSFFIGMVIMYLIFRGHEARRTILQEREAQGESTLLMPVEENRSRVNEEQTREMNHPKEEENTLDERCCLSSDRDGEHIRKSYGIRNGQNLS